MLLNNEKCTNCRRCEQHCPNQAITWTGEAIIHDTDRCTCCERCSDNCISNARESTGREYTIDELFREIVKDVPFYEQSGGGVTFSGGEALCQIEFVEELARRCQQNGISVVIDTCGHVPFSHFLRVMPFTDVFLYDIKHMNAERHRCHTGSTNNLILDNLVQLTAAGAKVNLRIPLIEGINADDANLREIVKLAKQCHIVHVNLLPYHDVGRDKYMKLNREYLKDHLDRPSDERLTQIQKMFASHGFHTNIGG
jgi:pyruvate formate lyase activating enzyme